MISLTPLNNRLRRVAGLPTPDFHARSTERWKVSPGGKRDFAPACMLPGQSERIRRTEFGTLETTLAAFRGEKGRPVGPTIGYRFRDVDLVDGVLYKDGAEFHLRPRKGSALAFVRPERSMSGALYESWVGNRWFGNWLMDDCAAYPLAAEAGRPVTTTVALTGHAPRYEHLLGMAPERVAEVHFDELILFDDMNNNAGRQARASACRRLLVQGRKADPVPGVFLLRGATGERRILANEAAIAEHLAARHGFRVMQAEDHGVDELIDACAGARIIAGVEGSQLVHGLAAMPPGGTLLTIQPPDRVTAALKIMCDRLDQRFAVLIAEGDGAGFILEADEIDRMLDLVA